MTTFCPKNHNAKTNNHGNKGAGRKSIKAINAIRTHNYSHNKQPSRSKKHWKGTNFLIHTGGYIRFLFFRNALLKHYGYACSVCYINQNSSSKKAI